MRELAKMYLRRIKGLEYAVNDRTLQIKNLRSLMGIKGMTYNDDRVQTSPDGQGFTRIADHIADIEAEIVELSKERQKIMKMIEDMPKQHHHKLLYNIFVKEMTLEQAAEDIPISYSWASHVYMNALDDFYDRYLKDNEKRQDFSENT